jgi:hypothetical protein
MKDEPPERDIPMYAFQLGLLSLQILGGDMAERVFNHAGRMAKEILAATLDPFNLPKDKAAVSRAFLEGVTGGK